MGIESRQILDPRLSATSRSALERAANLSRSQGIRVATVESLHASLLNHEKIKPLAAQYGVDQRIALEAIPFARPILFDADKPWDQEVEDMVNQAFTQAQERGAKRAGLVDLVSVVFTNEAVQDLYFGAPDQIAQLTRITMRFNNENCFRKQLAG